MLARLMEELGIRPRNVWTIPFINDNTSLQQQRAEDIATVDPKGSDELLVVKTDNNDVHSQFEQNSNQLMCEICGLLHANAGNF